MIATPIFSCTNSASYEFTCSSTGSEAYIIPISGPQVRITCEGANDAFIMWGAAGASSGSLTCTIPTANTGGGTPSNPGAMRLKAGAIEIFNIPGSCFAIRCKAGEASTISMTFGPGI